MKALVYEKPKKFAVKDIPIPEPKENEVRIKVTMAGVCGTDIHLHNGTFIGKYPLIPGHEMVGIIDKMGKKVNDEFTSFKIGQQVTMNGNFACGECAPCKRGEPLYCENLTCLGCNGTGAFAEYMVVSKELVYDAEGIDPEKVVFTEPLACTVHGMDVLKPKAGDDVLLFGAGSTGAMLAQLLIHGGAGNVTVVASKQFKLDLMKEYGINTTIQIDRNDTPKSIEIIKKEHPDLFDIVIDATGAPAVQEQCTSLVKMGGTVLFYGVGKQNHPIKMDAYDIFQRELTIKGSFAQVNSFSNSLAMLRSGRVRTDGLITHRFTLDQWQEVLDAHANDSTVHKMVVIP